MMVDVRWKMKGKTGTAFVKKVAGASCSRFKPLGERQDELKAVAGFAKDGLSVAQRSVCRTRHH